MAATAGLKAPPAFAKNEWAWAYTLEKLRQKDNLDEYGNPTNYAAAAAIYKRVKAKYGEHPPELPASLHISDQPLPDALKRAHLIDADLDGGAWHFSRGILWAANDRCISRLWLQEVTHEAASTGGRRMVEPLVHWKLEREYQEGGVKRSSGGIHCSSAFWLVRDSVAGTNHVRARTEGALAFLDDLKGDTLAARDHADAGAVGIGEHTVMPDFFDFAETLTAIDAVVGDLEAALHAGAA